LTDTVSSEQRRWIMSRVKSANTAPELLVRSMVHRMGYRFRLHRRDLPGVPDLAFPRLKKVIFVHGCFWHGHDCPRGRRLPQTNAEYWTEKLRKNQARDSRNQARLEELGWEVLVLWECELKDLETLRSKLEAFLADNNCQ